jgi:Nineteen complex-related protein 2
MAEYTGAKERIGLGKKSRKEEARKRKATIAEMIEDACVIAFLDFTFCGLLICFILALLKGGRRRNPRVAGCASTARRKYGF